MGDSKSQSLTTPGTSGTELRKLPDLGRKRMCQCQTAAAWSVNDVLPLSA